MKLKQTKTKIALILAGGIVAAIMPSMPAHAAGVELYFTPDKISVKKGEVFKVQARVNTNGALVEGGSIFVNWPYHVLEYGGLSREDSDFKAGCPDGLTGDFATLYICRDQKEGLTGDKLLGTITFKALADASSGTVDIRYIKDESSPCSCHTQVFTTDFKLYDFTAKTAAVSFTSPSPQPPATDTGRKENGELPESVATGGSPASSGDQSTQGLSDIGSTGVSPDIKSDTAITTKKASGKTGLWLTAGAVIIIAAVALWFYKFRPNKVPATKAGSAFRKSGTAK